MFAPCYPVKPVEQSTHPSILAAPALETEESRRARRGSPPAKSRLPAWAKPQAARGSTEPKKFELQLLTKALSEPVYVVVDARLLPPSARTGAETAQGFRLTVGSANITQHLDPFAEALDSIDRFCGLAPDSYDAARVTASARKAARRLIHTLKAPETRALGALLRPLHVAPVPDGGVHLRWAGPGGSLEVEAMPDGTLSFLHLVGPSESHSDARQDARPAEVARHLWRVLGVADPLAVDRRERAIALLQRWRDEESSYDAEVWPVIEAGLEANRTSGRRLFDG